MSAPELKPCPFCGGEAKSSSGNITYGRLWWAVWGDHCQVEMQDQEVWDKSRPGYLDPAYPPGECLTRWNTRATDARLAELQAERDRFEAALGRACLVGGTTYMVEQCAAMRSRLAAAEAMAEAIDRAIAEAVADDLDPWFAGMKAAREKWEAGK